MLGLFLTEPFEEGWTKKIGSYSIRSPWKISPGPIGGTGNETPVEAWLKFVGPDFTRAILRQAEYFIADKILDVNVETEDVYRYVSYILASGLVSHREERQYWYRSAKSAPDGLYGNQFIQSLFD